MTYTIKAGKGSYDHLVIATTDNLSRIGLASIEAFFADKPDATKLTFETPRGQFSIEPEVDPQTVPLTIARYEFGKDALDALIVDAPKEKAEAF